MKKNIVIGVLSVLVVGLGGILVYMGIQNKEKDTKEPEKNNTQEGEVGNNTNIEETKKEYIHFTSTELKFDKDEETGIGIMIEVKDGKLVETSNTGLTFSGIEGKVKYFTYDIDCAGLIGFLVLTEDNKVYVAFYDNGTAYGGPDKNITFRQLKTNEKVKDITEYDNPSLTTCSGIYLGVVFENDKLYGVEYSTEDKNLFSDGNVSLGKTDYSQYKAQLGQLLLYTDNSLSTNGSKQEKVTYNDQLLFAKKVYSLDGFVNEGYSNFCILDTNDMFYSMKLKITDWQSEIYIDSVSLVKNSKVSSIDEKENYITVTFMDGTKETYKAGGEEEKIDITDVSK